MKDSRLKRAGVSGFNKPKRTPSHPTKSHVVVAKVGSQVKTIRFGHNPLALLFVIKLHFQGLPIDQRSKLYR